MTAASYETNCTQFDDEINPFIKILQDEGCNSFLEIGSRFGGSFWRICNALPAGSRVVSLDSGSGMGGNKPGAQASLIACRDALAAKGYNARLVIGDSHLREVIDETVKLGPFDAVFIDGDHSMEGMVLDWHYFGKQAKKVCGFHDIAWKEPVPYAGKLVDCAAVWKVLKARYRSEEFVHPGGNMGVGVVWTKQRYR